MPSPKGSPAYLRKVERQNEKQKAIRAAARLAAHGGPALPPDEALRLEYQRDPIRWAKDVLDVDERSLRWSGYGGAYDAHVWDGDRDPFVVVCEALAGGSWVAVESGKGTGKTFLAAVLALWFLDVFPGSTVVTTATKEAQLSQGMWKEIGRFWPRFMRRHPLAELKKLKLRMAPPGESWSAFGWAAGLGAGEESASKAQGFHDEYQLIIVEETPGVKQPVITAFTETSTRPKTNLILAVGNPVSQFDPLHQLCVTPGVVSVRVSAYDHPNVVLRSNDHVKGAVTQEAIDRAGAKYGVGSSRFESSVRGLSPAQAFDALIQLEWVREAAARTVEAGSLALGVDVANSLSGDPAAIARGYGARLTSVETFVCPDAAAMYRNKVAPLIDAGLFASRVGVDAIGVGASTVNEAKRLGHKVQALQSGGLPLPRPGDAEEYVNFRAQMWWRLAQDLQYGRVGGAAFADLDLQKELTAVKSFVRSGKIGVSLKDDLRRLLGRSPNKADAVVYWNWARQSGGNSGYSGLGFMGSW